MVQIIERPKSTGQKLYEGFQSATEQFPSLVENLQKPRKEKEENEALERLTGKNFKGLSSELKKELIKKFSFQDNKNERDTSMDNSIKALDEIESLVGQSGIGMSGYLNPSENARFNRGKFSSLQAAILPIFKSMFPRGMTEKEFKFINENYIPQPHDTEQKIRGKIEGLRRLVNPQDQMPMAQNEMSSFDSEKSNKEKFDVSNPSHKARRDQVLKKTKGDRKKAEHILMKEFEL